jgi:hypothetical protein
MPYFAAAEPRPHGDPARGCKTFPLDLIQEAINREAGKCDGYGRSCDCLRRAHGSPWRRNDASDRGVRRWKLPDFARWWERRYRA